MLAAAAVAAPAPAKAPPAAMAPAGSQQQRKAVFDFLRVAVPFMENYAIDHLRMMKPLHEERQPNGPGITLTYQGLVIQGTMKDQGVIPDVITVTSRAWDIGGGLYVGMPFEEVKARFGKPMSTEKGTASYCIDGNCIRFTDRDGRLSAFQYRYKL